LFISQNDKKVSFWGVEFQLQQ